MIPIKKVATIDADLISMHNDSRLMIHPEDILEPEWLDWYSKTPFERLEATEVLRQEYIAMGGSLEPDADTQSPFWSRGEIESFASIHSRARERSFKKNRHV